MKTGQVEGAALKSIFVLSPQASIVAPRIKMTRPGGFETHPDKAPPIEVKGVENPIFELRASVFSCYGNLSAGMPQTRIRLAF